MKFKFNQIELFYGIIQKKLKDNNEQRQFQK
jgi:hypothetical protein